MSWYDNLSAEGHIGVCDLNDLGRPGNHETFLGGALALQEGVAHALLDFFGPPIADTCTVCKRCDQNQMRRVL
jgi:hypothetical protein